MKGVLVVNPTSTDVAGLRRRVARRCRDLGCPEPTVLLTTAEDPGEGLTRAAVAAGAEYVLCAGGDGTVRSVARGLAHTDVPMGVLPVGTGNLLARNLGLPLDLEAALVVALSGQPRRIDMGRVSTGARVREGFTVMAGLGFDAAMMADASPGLKSAVGWPAYLVSGARHLRDRPMAIELRVDGGPPHLSPARGVVVGIVGTLQAGLRLLPDAQPDDGLLDVVVLSPHRLTDWVRMVLRLVLRPRKPDRAVHRFQGRRLELTVDRPAPGQLDGDGVGEIADMLIDIDPGALLVRCGPSGPRRTPGLRR